ncbi:hypothetical protein BU15DRAFT_75061 [Melanogaster broomeanus]|nr:hypothetical protein BU15DRAFT_75061 [Melanogaster broomeanus]
MSFTVLERGLEGLSTTFQRLELGFGFTWLTSALGYRAKPREALAAYARGSMQLSERIAVKFTHIPCIPSFQFASKEASHDFASEDAPQIAQLQDISDVPVVDESHEDPCLVAENDCSKQEYTCYDDPDVATTGLKHLPLYLTNSISFTHIPNIPSVQFTPKEVSHDFLSEDVPETVVLHDLCDVLVVDETREHPHLAADDNSSNQEDTYHNDPDVAMTSPKHDPLYLANSLPSPSTDIPSIMGVQFMHTEEIEPAFSSEEALETEQVQDVYDVPLTHEDACRIVDDGRSNQDGACHDDPYVTIWPDVLSEDAPETERIERWTRLALRTTVAQTRMLVPGVQCVRRKVTLLALRRDRYNIVLDSGTCPSVSPHIVITPPSPSPDDYYVPSQNRPDPQWTYFLTVPLPSQMWQNQRPPLACDTTSPLLVENERTIEVRVGPHEASSAENRHAYEAAALEASALARTACERFARTHKERVFSWSDPAQPILRAIQWMHCIIIESDSPFATPHIVISEPSPQDPWIEWMNRVDEQDDEYLTIYGSTSRALDNDNDESGTWNSDPYGDSSSFEDSDLDLQTPEDSDAVRFSSSECAQRLGAWVRSKLVQTDEEDEFPRLPNAAEPEEAEPLWELRPPPRLQGNPPSLPSRRMRETRMRPEDDLPELDDWNKSIVIALS